MFTLTLTLLTVCCCMRAVASAENSTTESTAKSVADILDDDKERIIGGDLVLDGDLKYMLSLRFHYFHHCGASLIEVEGTQLAVTAAHCTEFFEAADFRLVAGDIRLSDKSGKEQQRQVTKIVNHEDYDPDTIANDIGLLFYNTPFILNEYVGTIPLPEQGQETKGTGIVSGWGVFNYTGRYADNLTKIELPIVDHELCKKAYATLEYEFFDHFLCAGFIGNGLYKDSCKGDSGGPLKSVEHGYLAGIVSWSEGCAHPRFPGVHTEVSHFVDWIQDEVSKYTSDKEEEAEALALKATSEKGQNASNKGQTPPGATTKKPGTNSGMLVKGQDANTSDKDKEEDPDNSEKAEEDPDRSDKSQDPAVPKIEKPEPITDADLKTNIKNKEVPTNDSVTENKIPPRFKSRIIQGRAKNSIRV